MAIVLSGANLTSATERNLSAANSSVEKSLGKLSSGQRITAPVDDAGGAAVAAKLEATLKRLGAIETNLLNADSFVRVQDDALKSVGDLVTRMSELKVLSQDVSKSPADVANYATEYWELASEIREIGQRKFNGIPLFSDTDKEQFLYCQSRQEGGQTIELVLPPLKEPSLLDVFGEHIYKIISGAKFYDDAESDADKLGGYLATITSAEEWKEIIWQLGLPDLTKDPLWIGLRQFGGPEPDGGWNWNTSEPYAYKFWQAGQPDNGGSSGVGASADALVWGQNNPGCVTPGHMGDEVKANTTNEVTGYVLEYTLAGKKVYQAVRGVPLSWDDAKTAAYGATVGTGPNDLPVGATDPHLATFTTAAEYADAFKQLSAVPAKEMLWLGAYQNLGAVETPSNVDQGWHWIADTPPAAGAIGTDPNMDWKIFGKGRERHATQPDNVASSVLNEDIGYISGPFGEWADSTGDPASKGIKGYLLEKENDFTKIPLSGLTRTLEWVAHYRARCGAESMAIGIAATAARTAHVNLEQARSRIADVDVAQATVALTRAKILSETGAQMLVKAHDAMQISLKLLQSVPAQ